jgi:DNA polymerase III delta subunit
MLYLLHGGDRVAARKKLHLILDAFLKKHEGAPITELTEETFVPEELSNLSLEQGLFSSVQAVVFDSVLGTKETTERVKRLLPALIASHNLLVFLEEGVERELLTAFQEQEVEVHTFRAATTRPEFNVFLFTDALGHRDRKHLWLLYQQALRSEGNDESYLSYLTSMLFWQVKSMALAESAQSAEEAGMKPYSFQKAKGFLKNYSREELLKFSGNLVTLTHDTRRGIHEQDIALERFILTI